MAFVGELVISRTSSTARARVPEYCGSKHRRLVLGSSVDDGILRVL
jgi:hypothetical protein